ncbi:hypothetical protein [Pseudoflavitalea rhizosphaerae]|uniref:hypothetical protein n=1 Tax=Pseudoflavitalea rhizosphaerae TaxID=1884793 RepID=UPI001F496F00|nr:hypothetical protein [Pseudoflavitalea rhizosphaerae]
MQVTGPSSRDIFFGKETGTGYQIADSAEEFAVEMRDISKKMTYQAPDSLMRFDIFLAAVLTESPNKFGLAV